MTYGDYLAKATVFLNDAGVGTARLDVLVLLEDITGKDRSWLLAHPEHEFLSSQQKEIQKLLKRRARHEPLAYIRGKTEFYGREFILTPAVLEPRPESETMIELLKTLPTLGSIASKTTKPITIADVGTGSGALGITAVLELPKATVNLLDIDPKALEVAKINVDKFTISAKVIKSDLLSGSSVNYDILLCNLPYVPDDYKINLSAAYEPEIAIFGGPDGLDLYRRLFNQVSKRPRQPLYILTEALPPQHRALEQIARHASYKLHSNNDFIQVFECIQKPGSAALKSM
ncbi:MAG TPA: HemK/PrmC family methyltransferase [Candidatus Dormibacteraeota bacterium]|nr:HemK/PrmC family methyltransferase [Candidatus Dormibacteraeota bacterium]